MLHVQKQGANIVQLNVRKNCDWRMDRMSISEQIKEIKACAYAHEASGDAIYGTANILYQAADTIEALSAKLADMERSAEDCGGWIPCKDRLPTKEECIKSDCRFIVSDGNRVHQGIFDYDINHFVWFNCNGTQIDEVSIAWMPLPEPYHEP